MILTQRMLSRATLARQLLLRRADMTAPAAIEHLAGVQAQEPAPPYQGLWTRLSGFRLDDLSHLLYDRKVVRGSLLRGTQHMVTADDYHWMRPLLQPVLDRATRGAWGRHTQGIDLDELTAVARNLLAGESLTRPEIGRLLAERYPGRDRTALGWTVQARVPVVHPPPNGVWGRHAGATPFTLAEEWIGRPLAGEPSPEELIRRYLAAFGPATVMDVQAWCGLTRLNEVIEPMRAEVRTFRNEAGKELFDVPEAPLPDSDVPAPVRFLPELDNLITGFADRTRIMTDERRRRVCVGSTVYATVLVDGSVRGMWAIEDGTLEIQLFEPLSASDRDAVEAEGRRLLEFAASDAETHEVRFMDA